MSSHAFFDQGDLVAVLTTQPLDRLLDYHAPEGGCMTGAFVENRQWLTFAQKPFGI